MAEQYKITEYIKTLKTKNMVTIIVLALVFTLGIWMSRSQYIGIEMTGIIIWVLTCIFMVLHLIMYIPKSYAFEKSVAERDSFELTLREARQNGTEMERAAIIKEVAEWNRKLATAKYDNSHWFFGQYVDDRVETLEPIK